MDDDNLPFLRYQLGQRREQWKALQKDQETLLWKIGRAEAAILKLERHIDKLEGK